MKLQNYILGLVIVIIFGCQNSKNEVQISGTITGKINGDVEYTTSENGSCYWGFPKRIDVDSSGSFVLTMNIHEPTFFQPLISTYSYGTLILEPGEKYIININLNSKKKRLSVISSNKKGQELYNNLPKTQILREAQKYVKDSVESDIIKTIDTFKNNEFEEFKHLLDKGEISSEFFDFVKSDRECYYSAITGNVAMLKFYENQRTKNGSFSDETERMWSQVFHNNKLISGGSISSFWFYKLVENYLKYKQLTDKSYDSKTLKEAYDKGQIHTHNITFSKKYLDTNILEYYTARYLHASALRMKYEKELLSLLEEFNSDFPDSDYYKFLDPLISPISNFHESSKSLDFNKRNIVDNYENINSLQECIECFKGKKVYIDVWATWCLPCRAGFKHKDKLNELLKSNDVELLYLSIDNSKRYKEQWRQMINFYDLEGYHILANKKLNKDLRRIYNKGGSMTIPWYILVDENGDFISTHAESPSNLLELEKQIK